MSEEQNNTPNDESGDSRIRNISITEYVGDFDGNIPNTYSKNTSNEEIPDHNRTSKKSKPSGYWANVISICGCIISLIVGIYTIRLFKQTGLSVEAAQRANEISEKANMDVNRAYITLVGMSSTKIVADSIYVYNITYENAGETPAYKIKVGIQYFIKADESYIDTNLTVARLKSTPEVTLGKHQKSTDQMGLYRGFSKDTIELLNSNKLTLFLMTRIVYYDVYNKVHHTNYLFKSTNGGSVFSNAKKYNDAD
jgi:hypothetical protein